MPKYIKVIILLFAILIISGLTFGAIDYDRVINHKTPLFCINKLDRPHSNETCWGIGYKIQRDIDISYYSEPSRIQNAIKFGLWYDKKELYRKIDYDDYSGDYFFTVKEQKKCSKSKLYYTDNEGRDYYLWCLDEVEINFADGPMTLSKALKNKEIILPHIINFLTYYNGWHDGGTSIYKDIKNEKAKYGFSILICKNKTGKNGQNNDIYIGPSFMSYEEGFCK
ncbi:MAG: hypothetical protein ACM3O4_00805 [Ignavibacteriales bacterium]